MAANPEPIDREKYRRLAVLIANATQVGGIDNLTDMLQEAFHALLHQRTDNQLTQLRAELEAAREERDRHLSSAAHNGRLVDTLRLEAQSLRERVEMAVSGTRDASPAAAAHCDSIKERTAFDYGYRVACHRMDDAIRAALRGSAGEGE